MRMHRPVCVSVIYCTHENAAAESGLYLKSDHPALLQSALEAFRSVACDAFHDQDEHDEIRQPDESERDKKSEVKGMWGQPTTASNETVKIHQFHRR